MRISLHPGFLYILIWGIKFTNLMVPCVMGDTLEDKNSDPFDRPGMGGFDLIDHVPGEPFSPNDYQNAEALINLSPPKGFFDPIELAELFEGDIILPSMRKVNGSTDELEPERNAINQSKQKWVGGIIPYSISSQFDAVERSVIARAFLDYQRQTCIVFRPRTNEKDYINVVKGKGCSSHVGRTGGPQPVTLGPGCVYPGIAAHELMHAVGFWHEQSRWDRDDHVNMYFNNIAPGMEFNFRKYSWTDIQNLSVSYDTSSVMHYGPYAFAKDRRYPTILPKNPNSEMGQRKGLSQKDVLKINRLYNCPGSENWESTTTLTPSTTTMPEWEMPTEASPPETVTEGAARCSDSHRYCATWSQRGECAKNSAWMLINCKKSCNRCDSPCSDLNSYCSQWSTKGECIRNPDYMRVYCAKSCNSCENKPNAISLPECRDGDQYCEAWAKSGECKANPKWMLKNCPKSCDACVAHAEAHIQNVIETFDRK